VTRYTRDTGVTLKERTLIPSRHGFALASRVSIWPRDPTTWNEFLPISMPIVATVRLDFLDMAVLRLTLAPSQHHSPVEQEHGRTIPLADHSLLCAYRRGVKRPNDLGSDEKGQEGVSRFSTARVDEQRVSSSARQGAENLPASKTLRISEVRDRNGDG
jgi:hypothetical protein